MSANGFCQGQSSALFRFSSQPRPSINRLRHQGGVTFIECLVTLAILLIVIRIVMPNFADMQRRLTIEHEQLKWQRHLALARRQAIRYQTAVVICPKKQQLICVDDWQHGAMSFVDNNGNRQFDDDDRLLAILADVPENIELRWTSLQRNALIVFNSYGLARGYNGTMTLCHRQVASQGRAVIVSSSGRLKASRDYNGDGVHEKRRNVPVRC
ncbi:GspH/FimT family pseudopilin [Thalassotalea maritima]|uniref:GspH/FimT family pseudopilin n=1 Tax=Thalassotalea maritima TaxID=3242416 RepID=UPI003527B283